MKLLLVSVIDRAVGAYQPISTVRAEGEAIRGFQDAINNPQNGQLHAHPEDFDLYLLATIDDNTGKITTLDEPKELARGKQLKIGA